jgi:predicted nucleotidyltransferase
MTRLTELARDLDTSGRTLRRYVAGGVVRSQRPSPRRVEITDAERAYLRAHWSLLTALMESLRTERNVRAAVFFGPLAEGTGTARSAVHLAVQLDRDTPSGRHSLTARVEERAGRRVDLVSLGSAPADEIHRGRVLIDRDPGFLPFATQDSVSD